MCVSQRVTRTRQREATNNPGIFGSDWSEPERHPDGIPRPLMDEHTRPGNRVQEDRRHEQ